MRKSWDDPTWQDKAERAYMPLLLFSLPGLAIAAVGFVIGSQVLQVVGFVPLVAFFVLALISR